MSNDCDCPLCTDDDDEDMTVEEAMEMVAGYLICIIRLLDHAGYPADRNRPLVSTMMADLVRDYGATTH